MSSTYSIVIHDCTLTGIKSDIFPTATTLAGDSTFLILLLMGLVKNWGNIRGSYVWNLLWTQGLVYILLAVLVDLPMMVCLALDLPGA